MSSPNANYIKLYSFLLIFLINFPVVLTGFNNVEVYDNNDNSTLCFSQALQNPATEKDLPLNAEQRSPDDETEANDNIKDAVDNHNELKDNIAMNGQLTYNSDMIDFFYIDLNGVVQNSMDRVNITPVFSDLAYLDDKAVGIRIKAYTVYNEDLFLLEYKGLGTNQAIINDSFPWKNNTSLFFNADRNGRYYVNISAEYIIDSNTNEIIDPDAIINYTLNVRITSVSNQDKNNDPLNGTIITEPKNDLQIIQGDDHWDWYRIESLTEQRNVSVSVQIKLTDAFYTDILHYVKVTGILKCFDLETNSYIEISANGDYLGSYHPSTIPLKLEARFKTAYLGIHSYQVFWVNNKETDSVDCGQSTVEYNIRQLYLNINNTPPELSQWNVSPKKGNKKMSYFFQVVYQDGDNDEPYFMNLTIEKVNYTMELSSMPMNDGIFSNGELYEITIPGSSFEDIKHDKYKNLEFSFSTRDYYKELQMPLQFVSLDTSLYISVINNILPEVRTDVPDNWTIPEDSEPYYIKLFKIFSDPDKKKYPNDVTFEIWLDKYGWKNVTENNLIRATVMDNHTLKIEPKPNKYGTDNIKIQAYNEFEGNLTAVEYNITIILSPMNDPPILDEPVDITDALEDQYVNITFHATDAIDKYAHPVLYSVDILTKIPKLDGNTTKYHYNFSEIDGVLSFLPDNSLVGKYIINITAIDNGTLKPIGISTTKSFKLRILNVNDAPVAKITLPKNNAKFNTSVPISLNAKNTTDDDLIHGDKLNYFWYIDKKDVPVINQTMPYSEHDPIKTPGKHKIYLKVKDEKGAVSWDNVTIWVINLVGDLPDGEDSDNDMLPDIWEIAYDLDHLTKDSDNDTDGDYFTNLQEFLGNDEAVGGSDSSDPTNPKSYPGDIDADELPDDWESLYVDNLGLKKDDDLDGDKYTNYQEYLGKDGEPGNDDWSNPLNIKDTPISQKEEKKKEEDNMGGILLISIVIIIIIIVLLLLFIKKQKKKAEEEKKKSKEKVPIYTPEPMPRFQPMIPPIPPMVPGQPGVGTSPGTIPVAQPLPVQVQKLPPQPPQQMASPPQLTPPSQQNSLAIPPTGQVLEQKEDKKQQ